SALPRSRHRRTTTAVTTGRLTTDHATTRLRCGTTTVRVLTTPTTRTDRCSDGAHRLRRYPRRGRSCFGAVFGTHHKGSPRSGGPFRILSASVPALYCRRENARSAARDDAPTSRANVDGPPYESASLRPRCACS